MIRVKRGSYYYEFRHNSQDYTSLLLDNSWQFCCFCKAELVRVCCSPSEADFSWQYICSSATAADISRSCCERNVITCLPLLNNNEFLLQTNPLWNFNYSVKAVICPCRDRAVSVESGKQSARTFLQRIPMTLNSSLWFFPYDWQVSKKYYSCFCNVFHSH